MTMLKYVRSMPRSLGQITILAKITFPIIISFSIIEIGLYSVYRKLVLATLKLKEKIYRSRYWFTRKRRFISLTSQEAWKIATVLFARLL